MRLLMAGGADSYAQFIAVLVVFILVLGLTAAVTGWIARYQKQQNANCNIELLEAARLSNNKYIQIVRIGDNYVAVAVCKDTVTVLCQVPKEQLKEHPASGQNSAFQELLAKALKKDSGKTDEPKER